jgi:hypothetical protein
MSFLFWTSDTKSNEPPRYNPKSDFIVTYNISGKIFSFSYLTLYTIKNSNLYKYAYEMSKNKLILDPNNFIYLDMSPQIFQYIHDYIKGYDIKIDNMELKEKEWLYKDAKMLNITGLVELVDKELPKYTSEVMNKWANIIAKSLITTGINIEGMIEACTDTKMSFPIGHKIRHLFETNEEIRQKIKKCVKNIMESQYEKNSNFDGLLFKIVMELGKETDFQNIIESFLKNINH